MNCPNCTYDRKVPLEDHDCESSDGYFANGEMTYECECPCRSYRPPMPPVTYATVPWAVHNSKRR